MISALNWFIFVTFQLQVIKQLRADTDAQCPCTPLVKSVDNFGASLIKAIDENDNIFISPLSIFNALAMTYIGARGNTAKELEDALQLAENGLDKTKLNEAFKNYLNAVTAENDNYCILIANGAFQQKGFAVKDEYTNDIREFYHGSIQEEDFVNEGNKAIDDINNFVAENTQNKIAKLFEKPLDRSTVLVLVNAVYYKGTWKIEFPKNETRDGIFKKNDGSTKTVKFMVRKKEEFCYFEDTKSGYKYLELPYKGEEMSMIIALPNDSSRVPELNLTTNHLDKITRSLERVQLESISIPKFQIKYKEDLKSFLPKLGINDLFTRDANLSGISDFKNLKVASVLHESAIDVNEEGSEAASATGVDVVWLSMLATTFNADHPFSFYIVDKTNLMLLFAGRVSDL